jgi:non-canonical poly(A) RNA polymerase PAPD5/7
MDQDSDVADDASLGSSMSRLSGHPDDHRSGTAQNDLVLGKRKRTDAQGPRGSRADSGEASYRDGRINESWLAPDNRISTPWFNPLDRTDLAGVALHKEILDFYEWIKPRQYEQYVRDTVFQRLARDLQHFMPGRLKAFGSYAAGLYLPTADMDVVYLTSSYQPGVLPLKESMKRLVHRLAKYLRNYIARPGSVVPIPFAKVPIVKFVDNVSGLKVDLCFDNDSGFLAIDTFQEWKIRHPAMPIIVSIVKHYLMIRELNDVSIGGLGGFSTICLVTSLVQLIPDTSAITNLGDLLLEFFNYYGNVFDRDATAIRLEPPGYVDKVFILRPLLFR